MAAGAVWAAPAVLRFAGASAAGSPPAAQQCTTCGTCGDVPLCGANESCGCLTAVEGGCFCADATDCGDMQLCTTTQDCVDAGLVGYACASSCCGELQCQPPCSDVASFGRRLQRVSSGKTNLGG